MGNNKGKQTLADFVYCGKNVKQEVTKFGSHSLSGFRVAANILVVWDKNPSVGNRVTKQQHQVWWFFDGLVILSLSLQKTIGKSVIDNGYAYVTQWFLFRTFEYQLLWK